jgi:hypothetical protein
LPLFAFVTIIMIQIKIIFLFVCIGSLFAPSNCFHFIVPRPELNVLDVHPFYYHDQYLEKNYSNSNTNFHTNSDDAHDFSHKHSRTNIFAFIVLVTLFAHHFNLLPN